MWSALLIVAGLVTAGLTIVSPAARPDCSASSNNMTTMVLKQWSINNGTTPNAQLTGTFTIYNPGPDETYEFLALSLFSDAFWHSCRSPDDPIPANLDSFSCKLDPGNNEINFQLQWLCSDLNPAEPLLFHASVKAPLVAGTDMPLEIVSLSSNSTG